MRLAYVCAALALASAAQCGAVPARSKAARAEFQRLHPCPATGQARGPCAGYVADHIKPLCAGGADHHSNMQWQAVQAGKTKDRAERRACMQ